jgi:hypothetical protein
MTNIEKWEEEFDSKFFKITVGYGERGIFHGEPKQLKDFIKNLLQTEQTRIAEEVEEIELSCVDDRLLGKSDEYLEGYNTSTRRWREKRDQVLSIIKQGKYI